MIVIGGSLGGMNAVRTILRGLPATFSVPIAIVLHRHKESDDTLVDIIQRETPLRVKDVIDKDSILPGYIYLSPADYHLLVEPMYFSLSTDEPVQYARPSIDVLFESAADVFGSKTIGIILTGANHDGALGAAQIIHHGGRIIVQDPLTAESPVMPNAALETAPHAHVLPVDKIAEALIEYLRPPLTS